MGAPSWQRARCCLGHDPGDTPRSARSELGRRPAADQRPLLARGSGCRAPGWPGPPRAAEAAAALHTMCSVDARATCGDAVATWRGAAGFEPAAMTPAMDLADVHSHHAVSDEELTSAEEKMRPLVQAEHNVEHLVRPGLPAPLDGSALPRAGAAARDRARPGCPRQRVQAVAIRSRFNTTRRTTRWQLKPGGPRGFRLPASGTEKVPVCPGCQASPLSALPSLVQRPSAQAPPRRNAPGLTGSVGLTAAEFPTYRPRGLRTSIRLCHAQDSNLDPVRGDPRAALAFDCDEHPFHCGGVLLPPCGRGP
jgi:hypothetical protein